MSALAAVTLRRQGAPGLLVTYADVVARPPIGPDGRRQRRNAAPRLLAICPAPEQWMTRPTPARLADIHRTGAWTFLAWCFTQGHPQPDLDHLLAKLPGSLYQAWAALHQGDTDRGAAVSPGTSPCQSLSKRTVIDLRCLLDDITLWGWADRPPARMLFPADIPHLDKPLPRALAPTPTAT